MTSRDDLNVEKGKQGFQPTNKGRNVPTVQIITVGAFEGGVQASPPVPINEMWNRMNEARGESLCVRHGGNKMPSQGCPECRNQWGTVKDGRPPAEWGEVNSLVEVAPGVLLANCSGHGGIKLSRERQAVIPYYFRKTWYEEDCAAAIVRMFHPDEATHAVESEEDLERVREEAERLVREYYPEEYEKYTGKKVGLGESYTADAANWYRLHENDTIVRSQADSNISGFVRVTAHTPGNEADTRTYLVPEKDLDQPREQFGKFLAPRLLPSSAVDVTPPANWNLAPPATRINVDQLTPNQKWRAVEGLNKKWKDRDTGEIYTLKERIESGYYNGKTVVSHWGSGRKRYAFTQSDDDSVVTIVPAAVYKAYDVPDSVSESSKIAHKMELARNRKSRAYDSAKIAKIEKEIEALETKFYEARDKETAESESRDLEETQWRNNFERERLREHGYQI